MLQESMNSALHVAPPALVLRTMHDPRVVHARPNRRGNASPRSTAGDAAPKARASHVPHVPKEQPLWKLTVEATLLGFAGAMAMFATEMLLFPEMMRAGAPLPLVSVVSTVTGMTTPDAHGNFPQSSR
jgi:hypothetical protein